MKYTANLFIKNTEAQRLEKCCQEIVAGVEKCGLEFDREVVFADGKRMAIQVCGPTDPAAESCWSQGVLFSTLGQELGCTDCSESFLGEYCVSTEDADYVVNVIIWDQPIGAHKDKHETAEQSWVARIAFCLLHDREAFPEIDEIEQSVDSPERIGTNEFYFYTTNDEQPAFRVIVEQVPDPQTPLSGVPAHSSDERKNKFYKISWISHEQNQRGGLNETFFVQTDSHEAAYTMAKHHIESVYGLDHFQINTVSRSADPGPEQIVIS